MLIAELEAVTVTVRKSVVVLGKPGLTAVENVVTMGPSGL
jgi:hypothetical protein